MKKMIAIILILCIAIGALTAVRSKPFTSMVSQSGTMDRDRAWKVTDKIVDSWDGSAWAQSEKYVYYYNANYPARIDSVYTLQWQSSASAWVPAFKMVYSYMPDQEYIGMAEYSLIMGGNNIPFIHIYAAYDNQDRLTEYCMVMYDMENSNWQYYTRMFVVYGAGTTFQVYQWYAGDETNPVEYTKSDFDYDAQGRIILETWQTSPDSLNWVNNDQTTRTYHPHDTMTGAQFISNLAHQMVLNGMEENGVFFGMVTEELNKQWDNSVWVNSEKSTYTYNANDKMTELLRQSWYNNIWNNNEKYAYTYDTNGNAQQMIYQDNPTGTGWNNVDRFTYTWSQLTANDDNITPAAGILTLQVYPNPFRGELTISAKSVSDGNINYNVYNLKGQIVRSLAAFNSESVTWDGLDNTGNVLGTGIYFVKATQGSITTTRKLLKLK